jgi:hypothetical protein
MPKLPDDPLARHAALLHEYSLSTDEVKKRKIQDRMDFIWMNCSETEMKLMTAQVALFERRNRGKTA